MTLLKTSMLNGIAVAIKMLTLLGINKVLALYVGPAGYAALGQFQNAIQMITIFASGAINTGVTKYTAEYHYDEEKQHVVWRTAGTIALFGSLLTGVVIATLSEKLASWFLKDASFSGVFFWFASTLVFFTLNALLLAILNGKKEIQRYVFSNIAGSLFAFAITFVMVLQFGLYGALLALAIYQSITFFVTLLICYSLPWFRFKSLFGKVDNQTIIALGKFSAMSLTSVACIPISHIIVRDYLGETFGWVAAGYWEASWRLSVAYLTLATTTLSVYFLPKFSELIKPNEIKNEIIQGYIIILPIAALSGLLLYAFRDIIIELLFTKEFYPMRELFAWQTLGDFFKIGSWMLAYLMLAKAMLLPLMIYEVIFSASFILSTIFFTEHFGIEGVSIAHAINYLIYWIAMAFLIKKNFKL